MNSIAAAATCSGSDVVVPGARVASLRGCSHSPAQLGHCLGAAYHVAAGVRFVGFADVGQSLRVAQYVDGLLELGQVFWADQHGGGSAVAGEHDPSCWCSTRSTYSERWSRMWRRDSVVTATIVAHARDRCPPFDLESSVRPGRGLVRRRTGPPTSLAHLRQEDHERARHASLVLDTSPGSHRRGESIAVAGRPAARASGRWPNLRGGCSSERSDAGVEQQPATHSRSWT